MNDMSDAELMRCFISMGCDCEFGSVQRQSRVEPPDLLRWGGTDMAMLLRMLADRFDHIGDTGSLSISSANNEYFVRNSFYGFEWHAWVKEGEMSPDRVFKREITRLPRQAEILIDDLSDGRRILVRKARDTSEIGLLDELVSCVSRYGGCQTLFVSQCADKAGIVERAGPTLLHGYLANFADPADIMANANPAAWLPLCRQANALS